ncbi:MAG: hypothetical protein HYY50_04160 [Candidatus Kerfeldbacteria bacterium]|nr:hypothetical protein [Candidatus Kerfeldbacteria bacterium]
MDVSPSTVRRWIHRVRSRSRKCPPVLKLLKITYLRYVESDHREWYLERESVAALKRALRARVRAPAK